MHWKKEFYLAAGFGMLALVSDQILSDIPLTSWAFLALAGFFLYRGFSIKNYPEIKLDNIHTVIWGSGWRGIAFSIINKSREVRADSVLVEFTAEDLNGNSFGTPILVSLFENREIAEPREVDLNPGRGVKYILCRAQRRTFPSYILAREGNKWKEMDKRKEVIFHITCTGANFDKRSVKSGGWKLKVWTGGETKKDHDIRWKLIKNRPQNFDWLGPKTKKLLGE